MQAYLFLVRKRVLAYLFPPRTWCRHICFPLKKNAGWPGPNIWLELSYFALKAKKRILKKKSDVKIIFVVSQEKFFSRHIVVLQQGPSVVKLCRIISQHVVRIISVVSRAAPAACDTTEIIVTTCCEYYIHKFKTVSVLSKLLQGPKISRGADPCGNSYAKIELTLT